MDTEIWDLSEYIYFSHYCIVSVELRLMHVGDIIGTVCLGSQLSNSFLRPTRMERV